jgi:hypothetical protein
VARVADAWAELMHRLGYDRYGAHGGDFGALASRALGLAHPQHVAAVHLTQVFDASATAENADLSVEAEQRSVEAGYRYEYELGGYAAIQATRPQLIAYGLTDSPVFQLAWIADGFKQWTDSTDVPEDAVGRDALLTNVMLYWLTGTAGSSARYYKEGTETWGEPEPPSPVPTAVAVFPTTSRSRSGGWPSATTTSCAGPSSTAGAMSPPWRSRISPSATSARPSATTAAGVAPAGASRQGRVPVPARSVACPA